MARVILASLNFAPGHINHIEAFARGFKRIGHETAFFLSAGYRDFTDPLVSHGDIRYVRKSVAELRDWHADLVFIVNPAVENIALVRACRRRNIVTAYLYHEPWRGFRFYARHGVKALVRAPGIRLLTIPLLREVDKVVVPSKTAFREYAERSIQFNPRVQIIPLLFVDRYEGQNAVPSASGRQYITFLGRASRAHQFDRFLDLVEVMLANKRLAEAERFLIATPTRLSKRVLIRLDELIRSGRVVLRSGRPIPTEEVNVFLRQSLLVWNAYAHSTQSGVMAQAFMHGTPVVATRVGGLAEYVVSGYNGELVDDVDVSSLVAAIDRIRSDLPNYVCGARKTFETHFEYSRHLDSLRDLLQVTC